MSINVIYGFRSFPYFLFLPRFTITDCQVLSIYQTLSDTYPITPAPLLLPQEHWPQPEPQEWCPIHLASQIHSPLTWDVIFSPWDKRGSLSEEFLWLQEEVRKRWLYFYWITLGLHVTTETVQSCTTMRERSQWKPDRT